MARRKTKPSRCFKRSILVYCDGFTEQNYVNSVKEELSRDFHIRVEPKLHDKGFKQGCNAIKKELDEGYFQKVFYILDMDTIYRDAQVAQYNESKKKLLYKAKKNEVVFIESRPCIEFWFLLHFRSNDALLENCCQAINELKAFLPDYDKNQRYTCSVYTKLKSLLGTAIRNAVGIEEKRSVSQQGEQYSYSEMHHFFDYLDGLSNALGD